MRNEKFLKEKIFKKMNLITFSKKNNYVICKSDSIYRHQARNCHENFTTKCQELLVHHFHGLISANFTMKYTTLRLQLHPIKQHRKES